MIGLGSADVSAMVSPSLIEHLRLAAITPRSGRGLPATSVPRRRARRHPVGRTAERKRARVRRGYFRVPRWPLALRARQRGRAAGAGGLQPCWRRIFAGFYGGNWILAVPFAARPLGRDRSGSSTKTRLWRGVRRA